MSVNWHLKIVNARKHARDHDTLDCLDELGRRLDDDNGLPSAFPSLDHQERVESIKQDLAEKADRKSYMKDYMRKRRAEKKANA